MLVLLPWQLPHHVMVMLCPRYMEPWLKAARRASWCLFRWTGSRAEPGPGMLQKWVRKEEEAS